MNAVSSPIRLSVVDTSPERRRAISGVAAALVAGVVTQALFWHAGLGLNFWLWDLLVLAGSIALLRRGRVPPTAWGAITASALLGLSFVLHRSEWTSAIAVPATLLTLAAVPILLVERHTLTDLARLPRRFVPTKVLLQAAAAETTKLPAVAVGGTAGTVIQPMFRGLVLGIPAASLFACLLASDPDFSQALGQIRDRMGDWAVFSLWSLLSAGSYVFTHALHRARPSESTAGGEDLPYREPGPDVAVAPPPRVSVVAWSTVVAQVALVFALFVGANLRHLFGGKALVVAQKGLTYANYLHSGFGELLFATILAVCLVLAGHRALRPRGVPVEGPVPGGKVLASLEGTLLVLAATTVASCWQRLAIYEDAYGASLQRVGVALIELFVLGVLALTFAKSIARGWKGHLGAVLTFATALAVAASAFDADAYVALKNLDRAWAGATLDERYLFSLSADASAALAHPFVQEHPELSKHLVSAYCRPRGDLRAFRGIRQCSAAGAK